MLKDPPRSPTLDFLIGIVGLWLAAGFLWDSWAHLHVGIETFFTPYHDVFYCAMLAGSTIMGIAARRNYALRYRGRHVLPLPYQRALLGIPIFFLGGIGDFSGMNLSGRESYRSGHEPDSPHHRLRRRHGLERTDPLGARRSGALALAPRSATAHLRACSV